MSRFFEKFIAWSVQIFEIPTCRVSKVLETKGYKLWSLACYSFLFYFVNVVCTCLLHSYYDDLEIWWRMWYLWLQNVWWILLCMSKLNTKLLQNIYLIKKHFVKFSFIVNNTHPPCILLQIHFILKTIQMEKNFTKNSSWNIKKDAPKKSRNVTHKCYT